MHTLHKLTSNIINILKLYLPVLIPSWNFFDEISASPRIQFVLFNQNHQVIQDWQELNPRPDKLSFKQLLYKLWWNPSWNESLFVISCAERILQEDTLCSIEQSENIIFSRIKKYLLVNNNISKDYLIQFRIVILHRETNNKIKTDNAYYSKIHPFYEQA